MPQQLLQRLGGHGTTPNHGGVGFHEETNRNHLHAVVFEWLHGFTVCRLRARTIQPHHGGLAGAINVGIEQTHRSAFGGQGQSQIDGGGALAHTAFARGHGDDVFDIGQQLHSALHRMGDDLGVDGDGHLGDARNGEGCVFERIFQSCQLALGGVAQLQLKLSTVGLHPQIFDLFLGDEVGARVGIAHGLQGLEEQGGGVGHERSRLESRGGAV